MLKRFIKYYKNYIGLFIADMTAAVFVAVINLFYPVITRSLINTYIPDGNIRMVVILCLTLLGVYITSAALNFFIQYYGHMVGTRMQADMRNDLFSHLQRLPIKFFDDNKTGALMSRITSDLFDVSELAHHGPEDLFLSLILLTGSFILMSGINIYLTLIVFSGIPILILFAAAKRVKMSKAFKQMRVENAIINAGIENSLTGIRVSKAYTNEAHENENFKILNKSYVKSRDFAMKAMAEFSSGTGFIGNFLYVIMLISCSIFRITGKIDNGDFAAFIIYVSVFMDPIKRIISLVEQFQNGMSGFSRFCEIMDTKDELISEGKETMPTPKGNIEYRNVTFAYGDNNILDNVSFKIESGKTLALVGPSGGGKTTVCNLLPRFYNLQDGEILIDGVDIKNYTLESLRKNIGIVSQDVFLFDATIYENIALGDKTKTIDDVKLAAKRAGIDEFINSLPQGLETEVGERGVRLSGGQKQRIAIARVFLKNPKILILDEATSALDNVTENLICQSLSELSEGRTTIVVAHRLSTVRTADEIIVITDEGVKERGNHEELLANNGIYKELFNSQFKEI